MPMELEEIEEQIRQAFEQRANDVPDAFLVALPSEPARASNRFNRRISIGLVAACVTVFLAAGAWILLDRAPSPSPRVSDQPAASTTTPTTGDQGSVLPDRVGVVDSHGNLAGYVDTAILERMPVGYEAWLREPIPVTKTQDPGSDLVGYKFRTAGFVDLATYNSPDFDVDALVAGAQAKSAQDSEQFIEGHEPGTP